MVNSRASGKMITLDDHIATGTESTYTYTPGAALDLVGKYLKIIVIMTGKSTAAHSVIQTINSITDYNTTHLNQDTTTLAGSLNDAATSHFPIGNVTIDGANAFYIETELIYNDASDRIMLFSKASAPHEGMNLTHTEAQEAGTTLTSITTATTASTWIAGTRIITLGVLK